MVNKEGSEPTRDYRGTVVVGCVHMGSHVSGPRGAPRVTPYGSPWGTSYSPIGPHGSHPTAQWVPMGHTPQPNGSPWVISYSPRGHTLWSPWGTSYSPIGPHRSHPTSKWVAPLVPVGPLSSILQRGGSPWDAPQAPTGPTLYPKGSHPKTALKRGTPY